MQIKRTVLVFVFSGENLLMILKKSGQGKGKWNVPGGKLEPGESDEAAALRETQEETGITPVDIQRAGELEFYFEAGGSWSNSCAVFTARSHTGALIGETEECEPRWISTNAIPWENMWESDRTWIPLVFAGKPFHRRYHFDREDHLLREEIVY